MACRRPITVTFALLGVALFVTAHVLLRPPKGQTHPRSAARYAGVLTARRPNDGASALPSRRQLPQQAQPEPPRRQPPQQAPQHDAGCTGAVHFSELNLNAAARRQWACARSAAVPAVMLTFGSRSMADFLRNWVAHVRKQGITLYLVGALDDDILALCNADTIAAATIPDAVLRAKGLDTSASLSRVKAYYRYQPGTFLRMGLVKQHFIRQVTDERSPPILFESFNAFSPIGLPPGAQRWPRCDGLRRRRRLDAAAVAARALRRRIAAARPPERRPPRARRRHSLRRPGAEISPRSRLETSGVSSISSRLYLELISAASRRQVQQYLDCDRHRWHLDSELNTGVVFFRATPAALAVLDDWCDEHETRLNYFTKHARIATRHGIMTVVARWSRQAGGDDGGAGEEQSEPRPVLAQPSARAAQDGRSQICRRRARHVAPRAGPLVVVVVVVLVAAGTMAVVVTLKSFESPAQLATLRAGARGVPLYGLPRGASSVDTSNASLRAIYR